MASELTVLAMIAAHNEEDILPEVVADLVAQGVSVHVLDDGSTDRTVERVEALGLGGKVTVERWRPVRDGHLFRLSEIVARKQALAMKSTADWFINADADEFRESPWPNETLVEGIRRVDALGYNAIDFAVLNFWPTAPLHDPGDHRAAMPYFERAGTHDRAQVRCWKRQPHVDLVDTGGHEVLFANRKIFPVRFLLRHYPLRGQAHAEKKIFEERVPRFDPDEKARGWHVQYAQSKQGMSFVRDPSTLERYDPDRVRLELFLKHRDLSKQGDPGERSRALEEAEALARALGRELDGTNRALEIERATNARLSEQLDGRNKDLAAERAERVRLGQALDARNRELLAERERQAEAPTLAERLSAEVRRLCDDLLLRQQSLEERDAQLRALSAELRAMYDSKTWRWTAGARKAVALVDKLKRKPGNGGL
jgi:hypothetical protein